MPPQSMPIFVEEEGKGGGIGSGIQGDFTSSSANTLASAAIRPQGSLAMSEGTVGQSFEINSSTMLSGFRDGDDDEDVEEGEGKEQEGSTTTRPARSEVHEPDLYPETAEEYEIQPFQLSRESPTLGLESESYPAPSLPPESEPHSESDDGGDCAFDDGTAILFPSISEFAYSSHDGRAPSVDKELEQPKLANQNLAGSVAEDREIQEVMPGTMLQTNGDDNIFMNSPFVENWLRQENGPLWLKGKPGSGKSVLFTQLVELCST